MDTATWGYIGIGLFVVLAVTLIGRWSRARPNRDPKVKEAVRQPKIIAVTGWIILPVGLLLTLVSASSVPHEGDQLPMLICGIVISAAAALLILIYLNWYVIIRRDEIVQRTAFRKVKLIRYVDIEHCEQIHQGIILMLKLRATDGTRIELNAKAFDINPVLQAVEYRKQTGQWMDYSSGLTGSTGELEPPTGRP